MSVSSINGDTSLFKHAINREMRRKFHVSSLQTTKEVNWI